MSKKLRVEAEIGAKNRQIQKLEYDWDSLPVVRHQNTSKIPFFWTAGVTPLLLQSTPARPFSANQSSPVVSVASI